jgi:hypothetical protein
MGFAVRPPPDLLVGPGDARAQTVKTPDNIAAAPERRALVSPGMRVEIEAEAIVVDA